MVCSELLPLEVVLSLAYSSRDRFKQPLQVHYCNLSTKLNSKVEDPLVAKSKEGTLDYYVNVGYAIKTFREELPVLFHGDLSYQIYRRMKGLFDSIFEYKLDSKGKIHEHKNAFQVDLDGNLERLAAFGQHTIVIRWSVHDSTSAVGSLFDGIFEYKLDSKGKIHEHKCRMKEGG
ncbi:uncharacterized protein LOC112343516 [Selaginella moellendorffii]|uniref:uncharacterized protein LOC112343516 n=1 Tax=Selaginella moellendorffii TaxID=88036 RepID=UPI000D1CEFD0|nr:uncharacterized protein LOC112343516 [Selaginella moellendorffii]|eukprot:XP_024522894.1 uncharacterized protein LOC112343516 [Selaginella moellendorffii]